MMSSLLISTLQPNSRLARNKLWSAYLAGLFRELGVDLIVALL